MAKKYIDAEKLRAEIERRKEKWLAESRLIKKGKDNAMYAAGKSSGYTEFLSLVTSLQQEQPEVDLDEEIETWISTHIKVENGGIRQVNIDELAKTVKEWGKGIARHFYELGLKAKEENK